MKRIFHVTIVLLFFLPFVASSALAGEVIDGIVATVNRQPIFQSDWEEAICFEAFMQQKPISQVTVADRVKALQRLIDRQLLHAQMGDETFLQPSQDDIDKDVAKLRAQIPNSSNDENWQKLLARYELTPDILRNHLRTELLVMNFVEVRLRPNVHVQPEEIEAYYKNRLLPDLQKNGGKVVALEKVETRIRELLVQQRMDELLDTWLHNLRQQAEIHSTVPIPAENAPAEQDRASGSN
ncbi:MAG: SurA N-terminal domain-containing protein [Candidatus Korobacteraceae bacterium]